MRRREDAGVGGTVEDDAVGGAMDDDGDGADSWAADPAAADGPSVWNEPAPATAVADTFGLLP